MEIVVWIYICFMKVTIGATWGHNYMIEIPDQTTVHQLVAELTLARTYHHLIRSGLSRNMCVIFGHSHPYACVK